MSLTVQQALVAATRTLAAAGIEGAQSDARRLMAHALEIRPDRLTLVAPDPLANDVAARFEALIARRAAREPVSHLTGWRAFYGRDFIVTPDVLDPRPETETLIAEALAAPFDTVLDLGTGSGCILLTLLAERPEAMGQGVDLSDAALAVARRNGAALGLSGRARFTVSDWFADVTGSFDLIVSNPPYIAEAEMAGLSPEVREHEPHMALTDGADGLSAYRIIAAGAPGHLSPGGHLMVEIGPTQGAAVADLLRSAGFKNIAILHDLDGRDRVVRGRI